jgi:hypothetical protein
MQTNEAMKYCNCEAHTEIPMVISSRNGWHTAIYGSTPRPTTQLANGVRFSVAAVRSGPVPELTGSDIQLSYALAHWCNSTPNTSPTFNFYVHYYQLEASSSFSHTKRYSNQCLSCDRMVIFLCGDSDQMENYCNCNAYGSLILL